MDGALKSAKITVIWTAFAAKLARIAAARAVWAFTL
jgi:hypothetical protein